MTRKTVIRVIFNQKGGVGKTTLAVNLAACAALSGQRTLLVDSDPQSNATAHLLGEDSSSVEKHIGDFYESCLGLNIFRQSLLEYVTVKTPVPNLHLVASDRELEDLRNKLENKHKIHKLRDSLRNTTYEQIFFDPPPAKDFFSLSCLIAAQEVVVPVDCDAFSVQAAKELLNMVTEVRQDHNPDLRVAGIIVNQFQKGTKHSAKIVTELTKLGFHIFEPAVPFSVKIRESHSESSPVVISWPQHAVSKAIQEVYASLEERSRATIQGTSDKTVSGGSFESEILG